MDALLFLAGPVLCAVMAGGALALAWAGGRSTARARTPRQAIAHLLDKLRGSDRERVSSEAFVFADLAGFTMLTEEHGDNHAARVAGRFCRSVRALLAQHRAHEVKSLGDGIMVRAASASDAVRLGLRIAEGVGGRDGLPPVRVAVHAGPAVERDGDWFGTTVNIAARVCSQARPGEVLVTEAAADAACDDERVSFEFLDERPLRNFSRAVRLHRASSASGLASRRPRRSATFGEAAAPSLAGAR